MEQRTLHRRNDRDMSNIRDTRDRLHPARVDSLSRPGSIVIVTPKAMTSLQLGQLRERCLSNGPLESAVGVTDPPFATP